MMCASSRHNAIDSVLGTRRAHLARLVPCPPVAARLPRAPTRALLAAAPCSLTRVLCAVYLCIVPSACVCAACGVRVCVVCGVCLRSHRSRDDVARCRPLRPQPGRRARAALCLHLYAHRLAVRLAQHGDADRLHGSAPRRGRRPRDLALLAPLAAPPPG